MQMSIENDVAEHSDYYVHRSRVYDWERLDKKVVSAYTIRQNCISNYKDINRSSWNFPLMGQILVIYNSTILLQEAQGAVTVIK